MMCGQCGADVKAGARYYSFQMKVDPSYVPTSPEKYHIYESHSIDGVALCEKCGAEPLKFIKSMGEKLQKAVE